MAQRFVRRPTTVEAVQWTGSNYEELREWSWDGKTNHVAQLDDEPGTLMLYIAIEDQWVRVRMGWWVVKDVAGSLYPCERSVFERSWEPASEEATA